MTPIYRDYRKSDYSQCEELVNEAWEFDSNFRPQALANIAKQIYTRGSEVNSNYARVVEVDGKVVGFIFGLNANRSKPKRNVLFGLKIMFKLLWVKPSVPSTRKELLQAFSDHEVNRSKLVGRGRSEIMLFVIAKAHKGKGFGTRLWSEFLDFCLESKVKSIIVETNRAGAATFYEQLGFQLIGDFDSPVHAFAAPNGQACMYEFFCK